MQFQEIWKDRNEQILGFIQHSETMVLKKFLLVSKLQIWTITFIIIAMLESNGTQKMAMEQQ